jgi:hypothetical protein
MWRPLMMNGGGGRASSSPLFCVENRAINLGGKGQILSAATFCETALTHVFISS